MDMEVKDPRGLASPGTGKQRKNRLVVEYRVKKSKSRGTRRREEIGGKRCLLDRTMTRLQWQRGHEY